MDTSQEKKKKKYKRRKKKKLSLEDKFAAAWRREQPDAPKPVRQYKAFQDRKFRFDFAWPCFNILVEIDGFGYGHQSIVGLSKSHEKANLAVQNNWIVLRYTSSQLASKAKLEDVCGQVAIVIIRQCERLGYLLAEYPEEPIKRIVLQ